MSNLRLKETQFYTLRHWKATQLYHQAMDILYAKESVEHKRFDSTLTYINIEKALFYRGTGEDFHVKIAHTPEEIRGCLKLALNTSAIKTSWCSLENVSETFQNLIVRWKS